MTIQIATQLNTSPIRYTGAPTGDPSRTLVERIVDKTMLSANYLASGISGGIAGAGAYGRSVLGATSSTTLSTWTNLWKAETIGPNLKVIGSIVAAPALVAVAALALPVSVVAGVAHGVHEVDSSKPREFTVGAAGVQGYAKTRGHWVEAEKDWQDGLARMGNEKLGPGEKPVDIPLIKTGKTLAVGAASAALGGVTGVVCATVSGVREVAVGVAKAATDDSLNLPGRALAAAGAVVGGITQGVAFGAASTIGTLGQGISQTWKNDSLVSGGRAAVRRAAQSVEAAASPESLLRDVPPAPPAQPQP